MPILVRKTFLLASNKTTTNEETALERPARISGACIVSMAVPYDAEGLARSRADHAILQTLHISRYTVLR